MEDYICSTVVSVDYIHNGKWKQKRLGIKSTNEQISDDQLLDLICDYYPTVTRDSVLFMLRRDGDNVRISNVDDYFESIKCRALADKDFDIGKVVVVNTEIFDEHVANTVRK